MGLLNHDPARRRPPLPQSVCHYMASACSAQVAESCCRVCPVPLAVLILYGDIKKCKYIVHVLLLLSMFTACALWIAGQVVAELLEALASVRGLQSGRVEHERAAASHLVPACALQCCEATDML